MNKHDVLLELGTTDFPLYVVIQDTTTHTTSIAVRLTTLKEANAVIRNGTPTGKTPLEAARATYNTVCGQIQLRAHAAGETPGQHLDRTDPDGKVLASLLRMRNLIATLEAGGPNDDRE